MAEKVFDKARVLGRVGIDFQQFGAVCTNIDRAYGVSIAAGDAIEQLKEAELRELVELVGKVTKKPDGVGAEFESGPTYTERQDAQAFIDGLRGMEWSRQSEPARDRLIQYVEQTGLRPSKAEIQILDIKAEGTLDELGPALGEARAAFRAEVEAGTWRADGSTRVLNPAALNEKESNRIKDLIERAADDPGLFKRREEEVMRNKIAALKARLDAPTKERLPLFNGAGSIALTDDVWEGLQWEKDPASDDLPLLPPRYRLTDIAIIGFVWFQLKNRVALVPGGWVEGSGEGTTLVITRAGFGIEYDPRMSFINWWEDLEHLNGNGWLAVERDGQVWRVRRGPRAIEVERAQRAQVAA